MNEAELQLALALLEKGCPDCQLPASFGVKPQLDPWCEPCCGAGKVPLLDPGLIRKPCAWGIGEDSYDHKRCAENLYRNKAYVCNGSGWLPSNNEMDWVRALNKVGYDVSFLCGGAVRVDTFPAQRSRWGKTVFEAAAQALGVKDKAPT